MSVSPKFRRAVLLAAALLAAGFARADDAKTAIDIRIIESQTLRWTDGWELFDAAVVKGFFKKQGVNLVRMPPD